MRTLDINGKELSFVTFLHHGSGGLTSIYEDNDHQRYVLKSTLGDDALKEATFNDRLGRLTLHKKIDGWEHLILRYIEGEDIDRLLAIHLDHPPMDSIGCAHFQSAYLENPYGGFPTGLERNITIAIKLVQAQEALADKDIVHADIQLANYVMTENGKDITIEGIDFGAAIDLSSKPELKRMSIINNNISSLLEALKAILPTEQYLEIQGKIKKGSSYRDIVNALEQLIAPKVEKSKSFTPSYVSSSSNINISTAKTSLPERNINRRHVDFIQRRLENSIRKNDPAEAINYLLHGAKLNERMIKLIEQKADGALFSAMKPYIEEHQIENITIQLAAKKLD